MTITDYHFFSFFASSLVNTLVAASHRHLMSWRFVRSTRFNRYCIERHDDIRICICKPLLLLRFCALLHTLIAFLLCPNYPIRLLSGLPLSFPPTCCLLSSNTHIRGTTLSSPLSSPLSRALYSQGIVVGFCGAKVFCLQYNTMATVEVSQSSSMYQFIEEKMFA